MSDVVEKIKHEAETLIQKHQQCWTMKIGNIKSSSWVIKVKRFDNFVKDVLKVLEEQQQKLQEFHEWLVQTEWRGVSSEMLEEFQERFAELSGLPKKKEKSSK